MFKSEAEKAFVWTRQEQMTEIHPHDRGLETNQDATAKLLTLRFFFLTLQVSWHKSSLIEKLISPC